MECWKMRVWLLKRIDEIDETVPIMSQLVMIPTDWKELDTKDDTKIIVFDKVAFNFYLSCHSESDSEKNIFIKIHIIDLLQFDDEDYSKKPVSIKDGYIEYPEWLNDIELYMKKVYLEGINEDEEKYLDQVDEMYTPNKE